MEISRPVALLPPDVAERIAAGEVIERPASVVKELVENSLDAGANEIAVILENGGKSLIEILDNGRGMSRADLALSVERHATSKLRSLEDLETLGTLGFRGEALPSVAAVSELSLVTRAQGQSQAWELKKTLSGKFGPPQPITFGHFLGAEQGTRVRVESLFAQVPARLKFLKSEGAEVSHVRDWMERLALSRPDVGMKLVSHDRTLFSVRPSSPSNRVKDILSEGAGFPVREANFEDPINGKVKIHAYWLEGLSVPNARKIAQVVNGRSVKDRLLQQALLQPFRQALLPGRFPALVLTLSIDPAEVDVNVHPTKTEVRFLDTRKIFGAVQKTVESLLREHGGSAIVPVSQMTGERDWASERIRAAEASVETERLPFFTRSLSDSTGRADDKDTPSFSTQGNFQKTPPQLSSSLQSQSHRAPPDFIANSHFAGIIFQTYLLMDGGHELVLIDQHAAHERVRYEELKQQVFSRAGGPEEQQLLLPEITRFPTESRSLVELRLPWIKKMGFDAEVFSEDSLAFRSVPGSWGNNQIPHRLKSLVERLIEIDAEEPDSAFDESLFERLASEACHSAVRAGDRLEPEEARALVTRLFLCEHPWNCPHGRPTVVRIPKLKFEEWFQRKV